MLKVEQHGRAGIKVDELAAHLALKDGVEGIAALLVEAGKNLFVGDGDGKDAEELASSLCRYYEARNREDMDRLPRVTRENVLILKYYSLTAVSGFCSKTPGSVGPKKLRKVRFDSK